MDLGLGEEPMLVADLDEMTGISFCWEGGFVIYGLCLYFVWSALAFDLEHFEGSGAVWVLVCSLSCYSYCSLG